MITRGIPGLTEQALLGWAGTRRVSALALHHKALSTKALVPAATALALFVAGVEVPRTQVERMLGAAYKQLLALGLVELFPRDGAEHVRATVTILPVEHGLVVCDRLDAPESAERVLWPDDSSYHLATAIAGARIERWTDLATGSAFAPIMRPELASTVLGVDLNPRAIRYAQLGAQLSGRPLETLVGDIAMPLDVRARLVTCNAPIVDDPDQAMWRRADRGFFGRLWNAARACVEPGGEVVVHCTLDAMPVENGGVTDELPGEVAIAVYTPPGIRGYGIMWWSPDKETRRAVGYRELTAARPHLDPRDRTDVLAGTLPPLSAAQV